MIFLFRHPWFRIVPIIVLSVTCAMSLAPVIGKAAQESNEAAAHLQRAADAMATLNAFHFELSTVEGKTQFMENLELSGLEGDVQRPDRFQASVTAKAAIIELTVKVVGIGDEVWVTDPMSSEERWIALDVGDATGSDRPLTDLLNPDRILLEAVNLIEAPTVAGEEEIDGTNTTQIDGMVDLSRLQQAGTPAATVAAGQLIPVSIWIDDEGLVRRLEIEGALTAAETPDVVRRLDLSGFDQEITIEAPI